METLLRPGVILDALLSGLYRSVFFVQRRKSS